MSKECCTSVLRYESHLSQNWANEIVYNNKRIRDSSTRSVLTHRAYTSIVEDVDKLVRLSVLVKWVKSSTTENEWRDLHQNRKWCCILHLSWIHTILDIRKITYILLSIETLIQLRFSIRKHQEVSVLSHRFVIWKSEQTTSWSRSKHQVDFTSEINMQELEEMTRTHTQIESAFVWISRNSFTSKRLRDIKSILQQLNEIDNHATTWRNAENTRSIRVCICLNVSQLFCIETNSQLQSITKHSRNRSIRSSKLQIMRKCQIREIFNKIWWSKQISKCFSFRLSLRNQLSLQYYRRNTSDTHTNWTCNCFDIFAFSNNDLIFKQTNNRRQTCDFLTFHFLRSLSIKCEMLCKDIVLLHNYTRISKWETNTWRSAKTYVENLILRMRQDEIRL